MNDLFYNLYMNLKANIKFKVYTPIKYLSILNKQTKQYENYKNKKKMFILQIPSHGNLGDQAIAYAQREFVEKNFNEYAIIEVPFHDILENAKGIKNSLNKGDFIFIHGGGNMGDMYLYEEHMRRFISEYFENTNVIAFPQTISFSNSFIGNLELSRSKKVYENNKNLLLIARETKSYDMMKEKFPNANIIITPDIVLSLDKRKNVKREGVLTCLRNDIERVLDNNVKDKIIKNLKNKYDKVIVTDTLVNYDIPLSNRTNELEKIWGQISEAEVVITDRLHGMIFCAITGTPCIVFKNFNHKIEYSYKNWLSDLEYIKFVDSNNVDGVMELVQELRNLDTSKLKFNSCKEKYNPLIEYINSKELGSHE